MATIFSAGIMSHDSNAYVKCVVLWLCGCVVVWLLKTHINESKIFPNSLVIKFNHD